MVSLTDDAAVRDGAVLGSIAERRSVAVAGPDRRSFLQGFLTNDIVALSPGRGCYAAWLTPQGRMLTDMHVLEEGDMILLDVPAAEAARTVDRLEQFHFAEDVHIENLEDSLRSVWLHGPRAAGVLSSLATPLPSVGYDFAEWVNYQNARTQLSGTAAVVARVDQLGVPGYAIYVNSDKETAVRDVLVAAGARLVPAQTIEAARIEAAYPVFGVDMTEDTIPLEADIQDRAISLTKGCYVGQEVIIRVLHRGQGRVARKLVGLQVDGDVPRGGAQVRSGDRTIGIVTSAVRSVRLGALALAYVHRDFVDHGTRVEVDTPTGVAAATVRPRRAA